MNPGIVYFTKDGYEKLASEYKELIAQRPDAVDNLKRARELGDLSENGYYKASRAKLSFIDSRLMHHKLLLKRAQIIQSSSGDQVNVGCKVILDNGNQQKEFRLVSKYEANPAKGMISDVSPIGRALLGKRVSDKIEVETPSGKVQYIIRKIESYNK